MSAVKHQHCSYCGNGTAHAIDEVSNGYVRKRCLLCNRQTFVENFIPVTPRQVEILYNHRYSYCTAHEITFRHVGKVWYKDQHPTKIGMLPGEAIASCCREIDTKAPNHA